MTPNAPKEAQLVMLHVENGQIMSNCVIWNMQSETNGEGANTAVLTASLLIQNISTL